MNKKKIKASVPCRVDLGGTLDISTFFLPLNHLRPSTFNIALDMRTKVTLSPWKENYIKISSRGFKSAEFEASKAPFNHPMGLMFAVVNFFNGHGIHVHIESSSPPRSALGGSSSAAVAMIAAISTALDQKVVPRTAALMAHFIESSVAGVPCGLQDQLAAAFGGINRWYWTMGKNGIDFIQEQLIQDESVLKNLNKNILVAYCGIPHVSSDINKRWVNQFLSGQNRDKWKKIAMISENFSETVKACNYSMAASLMNKETRIRLSMTQDVLDKTGLALFELASNCECGARFTGAGGGGCIWAIGDTQNIQELKAKWQDFIEQQDEAELLNTAIDHNGIIIHG